MSPQFLGPLFNGEGELGGAGRCIDLTRVAVSRIVGDSQAPRFFFAFDSSAISMVGQVWRNFGEDFFAVILNDLRFVRSEWSIRHD